MGRPRRCLSLTKGAHRYVFCYSEGHETNVLESLVRLAEAPEYDFDWFDASVLSYQLGKRIGNTAERHVELFLQGSREQVGTCLAQVSATSQRRS